MNLLDSVLETLMENEYFSDANASNTSIADQVDALSDVSVVSDIGNGDNGANAENVDMVNMQMIKREVKSKMGKDRSLEKCRVCDDKASGKYFGAIVCVPCKTFFLRYAMAPSQFQCKNSGECMINVANRTSCKFCRLKKCYAVGMKRKVRPEVICLKDGQQLCCVCHDAANGVHFGVVTCEGCKKFFRRGLTEHKSYSCKKDGNCVINPASRNSCRYCRYKTCVKEGMARDNIQMGRPSKNSIDIKSNGHRGNFNRNISSVGVLYNRGFQENASNGSWGPQAIGNMSVAPNGNYIYNNVDTHMKFNMDAGFEGHSSMKHHLDMDLGFEGRLNKDGYFPASNQSHDMIGTPFLKQEQISRDGFQSHSSNSPISSYSVQNWNGNGHENPAGNMLVGKHAVQNGAGNMTQSSINLECLQDFAQFQNALKFDGKNVSMNKIKQDLEMFIELSTQSTAYSSFDSFLDGQKVDSQPQFHPSNEGLSILSNGNHFDGNVVTSSDNDINTFGQGNQSFNPDIHIFQVDQHLQELGKHDDDEHTNGSEVYHPYNGNELSLFSHLGPEDDQNGKSNYKQFLPVVQNVMELSTKFFNTTLEQSCDISDEKSATSDLLNEWMKLSIGYWQNMAIPDPVNLTAEMQDQIRVIMDNYQTFKDNTNFVNNKLNNDYASWKMQGKRSSEEVNTWVARNVITAFTTCSLEYHKTLPKYSTFSIEDQKTLLRLGMSTSRILIAANEWYEPATEDFPNFLPWRSAKTDAFKQKLVEFAKKIKNFDLNRFEAALFDAVVIISADFPKLQYPGIIQTTQNYLIGCLRNVLAATNNQPDQRKKMQGIFSLVTDLRLLGYMHYKMTTNSKLVEASSDTSPVAIEIRPRGDSASSTSSQTSLAMVSPISR